MRTLVLLAGLIVSAGQSAVSLTVSAPAVDPGASVTVTWQSPAAEAFITGIGRVPGSGTLVVRPAATTDYVLVSSDASGLHSTRAHVDVIGTRGATGYPDLSDFRDVRGSGEKAGVSFAEFTGRVYRTLEQAKFGVRGDLLPGRPYWLLYTDFQPRRELVRSSDRGIRSRDVAYGVRISDKAGGRVYYEIFALVRYQRLAEARIRDETDPQVIQAAVDSIRKLIETP